ncbi:leucine-rich repeat serine/threonine-protein kinase 2 isoform X1 [Carcharodon carcharias]|uniref:leucine-rich repeat serine/threonine-protein kinase 2 isoform X1 n=2 Tax=Carcharodon carcharias TaxID=13397 RepID=UPI001B7EAB18|nr:leucine-rich repeat serine/threonine-protein kinase 2 isoform X1 [Carcharodon carcharias]XP_041059460.1 leucine-rich repeat serine/threonine-protein kinase 2 isoform X1 [Carcharodon carcharias]
MADSEQLEENLKKLIVRLQNVEQGKEVNTLLQILDDLILLTTVQNASILFGNKNVHMPLLVVLESFTDVACIQQAGWSLLCKLMELCPDIINKLATPQDMGKDWDVLGVHQQMLNLLMTYNFHPTILLVGLKVLTLLVQSDEISLLLRDEEMDVFSLVLDGMKTFSDHCGIQLHGCQVLCALLEKVPDEQVIEFVEGKDHWVILEALKNFNEHEDMVHHGLRTLLPLAGPTNNVEILMSGNEKCYSLVTGAMKRFPESEAIHEIGCCLLQRFTLNYFYNILLLNGVHEVVINAVLKYPQNGTLQAAALNSLALLTETIFVNKDLEGKKDDLCWSEACCQALESFKENAKVQEAACWALYNLLLYKNDLHTKFGDEEACYPVHRLMMAAMLLHSNSKEVFQAAANALATLADKSVQVRKLLLAKGIHINILDLMKKYSDSCDVLESACKLLNKLFLGSTLSLDIMRLTSSRIVDTLKSSLQTSSVQLEALRVMSHIICPVILKENMMDAKEDMNVLESMQIVKQCLPDGFHGLVLEALNKFIGNPDIQHCGLQLLCSIADHSGAPELMRRGALVTVIHISQMYPYKREILYLCLKLLGFLVPKKDLYHALLVLVAEILLEALRRYEDDIAMQIQGFQAVLMYFKTVPSAFGIFFKEGIDRFIFHQMADCRNKQLQSLLCKCLCKLAIDRGIRNQMLENACSENNVMMVEYLIFLKADVNHKSKNESLIYQACKQSSSPLLVELLLNSGAREQDIRKALEASIKMGDDKIISLLLRKLGLDQNNKAICLGGFHMGKIEAAWLRALFPDEKSPISKRELTTDASLTNLLLKDGAELPLSSTSSELSYSEEALDKNNDCTALSDVSATDTEESSLFDDLESEGSYVVVQNPNYSLYAEMESTVNLRHDNSLSSLDDVEPAVNPRRRSISHVFYKSGCASKRPSFGSGQDQLLQFASETEFVWSLDLSENDLENLNFFSQNCCIVAQLAHLHTLDLSQNNLVHFSQDLCTIFKCLTDLDISNNKFTSFPSCMLEMQSIVSLDISRNNIGHSLSLNSRCPTLKKLNLSQNQLPSFPDCLGKATEKLEELLLKGNKMRTIVSSLCLTELNLLDLSQNCISTIVDTFLIQCSKLETFRVSENHLGKLSGLPSKITAIDLASNKFDRVPEAVLKLQHLRSVNLSRNNISELPGPIHWESSSLRELIFSHNQISALDLNEGTNKWLRLEKLNLNNNKLKELPPQIGLLENLTSLLLSYNSDLRSLPNEMGKLQKLWELELQGLFLDLDLKHVGSKTKDIIRFLHQRLKKAVPYYRMKLMIVGNAGSGKTTLLQQLMKCKQPNSGPEKATIGIDVKEWSVHVKAKIGKRKEYMLSVWDFAGQEEFYSTHPHFMSPRALYLVVYDLSKGVGEIDAIKPWLFNIKARSSSCPVILVGTHVDMTNEKHQQNCITKIKMEFLQQHDFPPVRDYHFVVATEESDSVVKLRRAIISELQTFKIRDQPVMGQLIPHSYMELEKKIIQERKTVLTEFPVIHQQRLLEIVQENNLQLDENELSHAVHFLNESGVLLHFHDPALHLRDLYFVDPQWLCKMMVQIVTVKAASFPKHPCGIIYRSDVEKYLSQQNSFPQNYMSQYIKLLEKFQIALPLGEEQLLIPSSLPDQRPVIELPHCENSELIIRLYEMPYFPMGFWSRLINRLLEVSAYLLRKQGGEKPLRPNRTYWRQGVYLIWSPEAYCLVDSTVLDNKPESILKITVPCCRKGFILLGQIVDHIDSLMEEWFPGLLETDISGEGGTLLKKYAMYSFEDDQECQQILIDDLLDIAEEGDFLTCPTDRSNKVSISRVAPDLVLVDLPRNIMLDVKHLKLEQTPDFLLGDGGFASVYRATYRCKEVAVKIFNKHVSKMHLHRLLRQELAVLSYLHHPSLVSLLAADFRPRMLVMELAPKGSLDLLLNLEKDHLNRTLQHRIALQVADGLRYLHSSMIIYRDMKPHNVLLFSLNPNSAIIAKIADYGIAQYCCRMGIKSSEGTPGFRAPEVAKGNVIYNHQADVYSFGLLLYDLMTNGERISTGMKFPNDFDEMAIQGKLPDPVKELNCSPWPGVQTLIDDCLKQNPEDRPTASQVYDTLNSVELLCLKRRMIVPSNLTADCLVVTNSICRKPSVWIGSGKRDKAQLSCLELDTDGQAVMDIEDNRILCLALVCVIGEQVNWVVAGTQSGHLWIINTENVKSVHQLRKMSDSITCLFCTHHSKHSKEENFLLVGTADGKLAAFKDTTVKYQDGAPLKVVDIGDISTPLVCFSMSSTSEQVVFWASCGTKIISLTSDFTVQKVIDTKTRTLRQQKYYCDGNIITMVIDKYIYLAKKDSHIVELWDKKSYKLSASIDCSSFLKNDTYSARVKTLHLQKATALWIGTGGGDVILLDLSTHQSIQVIDKFCHSIRSMVTAQIEKGHLRTVMLILGNVYKDYNENNQQQSGLQSQLFVWDMNLPYEIQSLKKHTDMRREIIEKMRTGSLE